MDSVGLTVTLSRELYTYYRAVKHSDDDIRDLRTQLLGLQAISDAVATTLKRQGVAAESHALVDDAIARCSKSAACLQKALDKIKSDHPHPEKAAEKLKAWSRKAEYPFKKETISELAQIVKDCRDALALAVTLLGVQVGARTSEQLQRLDDELVNGFASLEAGLQNLSLAAETTSTDVLSVSQDTKTLLDEAERRKAQDIVDSLVDPELARRRQDIPDVEDETLDWFITDSPAGSPARDLLSFLQTGSGTFWVKGKPASGKSTLMKFLADTGRIEELVAQAGDDSAFTIASHYFWIPGTKLQKSQQGLLQALLSQILSQELAIVPVVTRNRWTGRVGRSSWSVKELWTALQTAVQSSGRKIIIFVDGLDECHPESEHHKLATGLTGLAANDNVRLIVSSRPWSVFERNFGEASGRQMTMEEVNQSAIFSTVRSRLESVPRSRSIFEDLDWGHLREECEQEDEHTEAFLLTKEILQKADGNFLWVTLVLDAVCAQLATGRPIRAVRKHVDGLPRDLGQYFRELIMARIHESRLSDTAMALKIALCGRIRLGEFWMLYDSMESGESWLANPRFALDMALPHRDVTHAQLGSMIAETRTFLSECCRDLLLVSPGSWDEDSHYLPSDVEDVWSGDMITFTHRTVYDFLQTEEMQDLLRHHTPTHFQNDTFPSALIVARWKLICLSSERWERSTHASRSWNDILMHLVGGLLTEELATEAEAVTLMYLKNIPSNRDHEGEAEQFNSRTMTVTCLALVNYKLYAATALALEKYPAWITGSGSLWHYQCSHLCFALRLAPFRYIDTRTDETLTLMLLESGMSPNEPFETWHFFDKSVSMTTPWRGLLLRLVESQRRSVDRESDDVVSKATFRYVDQSPILSEDRFTDAHIQRVIYRLLKAGADTRHYDPSAAKSRQEFFAAKKEMWLEDFKFLGVSDPLHTLETHLPMDSELYDWPSILQDLKERHDAIDSHVSSLEEAGSLTDETRQGEERGDGAVAGAQDMHHNDSSAVQVREEDVSPT